MNEEWSQIAANAISHWAERSGMAVMEAAAMQERPSVLYRPRIFIDGDQWCALYGDNLQDGVAGFGDSPEDAMWRFNQEWSKKLAKATGEQE